MTNGGPGRPSDGAMNIPRDRTSDQFDALLDGGASGDPRLDELLSAARAPARPHELDAATPAISSAPRPSSRSRRVLTRLSAATVTTKVVAAVAGVAVAGAAAVAGATGHLPGQSRHHHHHAPAPVPSSSSVLSPSAPRSAGPTAPGGPSTGLPPSSGAPVSSTPSLAGSSPARSTSTVAGPTDVLTSPGTSRSVTRSPNAGRSTASPPSRRSRPSDPPTP